MRGFGTKAWLYLAALTTGLSFSVVFTGEAPSGVYSEAPESAFLVMLGASVLALAVGSAGKYRFVLIPPATALYTLLVVYGFPPVTLSGWRGLFLEVGNDFYEAGRIMYLEPVPYDLYPGLVTLMVPLAMVLLSLCISLTLYERTPILSIVILGGTIAVISTSSFETGAGPYFFFFLISAVALLLNTGKENSESPGRPSIIAGVAVAFLALAVPVLPYSNLTVTPGLVDWTNVGNWGTSRLETQADVGDYLNGGRDAMLFEVRSEEPLQWRGGTLDYFDGARWSDTTGPGEDDGEEISAGIPTRQVRQEFEIRNSRTSLVFGGYKILQTSLEEARQNSDGSWSVDEPLEAGDSYTVISEVPQPTEQQLRGAGTNYPAAVRNKFLQTPDDMPQEVSATARTIQERYNTDNPYNTARAIELYLTQDGGFTYNLEADYRRADRAIEKFLAEDGDREGFCTQFATSMALIARDLDIPSRVVYGSTEGEISDSDEYVVRGRNMHTWVELYFPGIGWYSFDPTPGFTLPNTMQANAPAPQTPVAQESFRGPAAQGLQDSSGSPVVEGEERTPEEPEPSTTRNGTPNLWPFLLPIPIVLLVIPLVKRALLLRGRPEDFYRDLSGRLRNVLEPGRGSIADSPALTPTERLVILSGAAGLREDRFRDFARAYSDHLYSPEPTGDVEQSYRRALRELNRLPLWRRLLGAVNPASLLARSRGGVASLGNRLGKALRGAWRGAWRGWRERKR